MIVRLAERDLITKYGVFREILYFDGQKEIIALVMGDVEDSEKVLCRIHSACISAHVFNSIECDCREQFEISQIIIQKEKKGIIIWLDQEGRDNGHFALITASKLSKELKINQTDAYKKSGFTGDARNFTSAAEVLQDLNVSSTIILTNNPNKANHVKDFGINVSGTQQVAIDTTTNHHLISYYKDKIDQGHDIPKGNS